MTLQRTLTAAAHRQRQADSGPSEDGSANSLVEQAQAFAQVARESLSECQRGAAAVEELRRRRNKPGQ